MTMFNSREMFVLPHWMPQESHRICKGTHSEARASTDTMVSPALASYFN